MSLPLQITGYVCQICGWSDVHSIELCPRCGGSVKQSAFTGKGKIVTYTAIRYPPKGFENQAPYVVAIIDIENGPRVMGRVTDPSDDVKIDSVVSLSSVNEDALEFRLVT